MYDRILVPTDGSEEVERAVQHAVDLAATHGGEMHAIYVIDSASYGGVPMETAWEGLHEMLEQEGETALERVEALATAGDIPVETSLLEGGPAKQIVGYAESEDCDLVVMGTHGRGGIDRLLLGSVTERVVRSSNVPVLTVQVSE